MAVEHRATPRARDASLRRLGRINRWLIAGSVALTGVLADVAANAFGGRTIKSGVGASATKTKRSTGSSSSSGGSSGLQAPSQAPQGTESSQEPRGESSAPSQESQAPSQESQAPSQESSPSREAAPSQESPPPEASREAAPQAPEAAVSGGS
jgi:hypothetical protein